MDQFSLPHENCVFHAHALCKLLLSAPNDTFSFDLLKMTFPNRKKASQHPGLWETEIDHQPYHQPQDRPRSAQKDLLPGST